MANGKTFHRITNDDIYKSIQELHGKIEKFDVKFMQVDSKLNMHRVLIYGAFSALAMLVGVIVAHVIR